SEIEKSKLDSRTYGGLRRLACILLRAAPFRVSTITKVDDEASDALETISDGGRAHRRRDRVDVHRARARGLPAEGGTCRERTTAVGGGHDDGRERTTCGLAGDRPQVGRRAHRPRRGTQRSHRAE